MDAILKKKKIIIIIVSTLAIVQIIYIAFSYLSSTHTNKNSINDIILWNTHSAKYNEEIEGKICDIIQDRGLDKFVLCNEAKGYFFEAKKNSSKIAEIEVNNFIIKGETRIVKNVNSALVFFINKTDTLEVEYEIYKENLGLMNGKVIK